MITVRQIDRLWSAKSYDRLLEQLVSPRPESSDRLLTHLAGSLPVAAIAVIRLDELSQPFVPLYSQLVRTILASQRPDGGWGDVMSTALCLRALLCGNGHGPSIDCGLHYLATLQKPEGIWPNPPMLRMPIDPFASAFVLLNLSNTPSLHNAIRVNDAVKWFETNELALDQPTKKLWQHARRRLIALRHAPTPQTQHDRNMVPPAHGLRYAAVIDGTPSISARA